MVLTGTLSHDMPPPHWARIWRLGSEHIFGVCVMTFDIWHSAISFDLVQGNMLVSHREGLESRE